MNSNTKKIILVIAFVVVLGAATYAGVSIYKNVNKLKKMSATFGGVEYLGFKMKEMEAGIKITLNLKNDSDFTVKTMSYNKLDVYLNDVFISPVISKDTQTIAPNSISPFSFNIYFSPFKIIPQLTIDKVIAGLTDIKNIKIRVTGYITASVDGIKVENLPVNLEMLAGEILKTTKPQT